MLISSTGATMRKIKSACTAMIAMVLIVVVAPLTAHAGSVETARRLVDLLELETQLHSTIIDAVDRARDQLMLRGVPAAKVNNVADILKAEMLESTPELLDEITLIYADEFTDPELNDLIAFYSSPTGQKLISKRQALDSRQAGAVRGWITSVQQRALEQLQEALV